MKITELTAQLAAPAIEEQGCTLWDVEYVKEAGTWYLRVLLDEVDPIEGSYTLEVGSAGAERALKRPGDFQRYLGAPVLVKTYRNMDGRKEFAGHLKAYNEETGDVTITVGTQEMTFTKKDTALVRLRVEF